MRPDIVKGGYERPRTGSRLNVIRSPMHDRDRPIIYSFLGLVVKGSGIKVFTIRNIVFLSLPLGGIKASIEGVTLRSLLLLKIPF